MPARWFNFLLFDVAGGVRHVVRIGHEANVFQPPPFWTGARLISATRPALQSFGELVLTVDALRRTRILKIDGGLQVPGCKLLQIDVGSGNQGLS